MEHLNTVFYIILVLSIIKSIIIGSKFNFYHWIKYGKKYLQWYDDNITSAEYKEN